MTDTAWVETGLAACEGLPREPGLIGRSTNFGSYFPESRASQP
jgi:hypothetical protein